MTNLATVKSNLKLMGIMPLSQSNNQSFVNYIHVSFVCISLLTYTLAVLYILLFKASDFAEYAEAGLFCSVNVLHITLYHLFILKRSQLFTLIKFYDEILQKSK